MRLNTTKAIITGGASGLGEATARYLTSQGAKDLPPATGAQGTLPAPLLTLGAAAADLLVSALGHGQEALKEVAAEDLAGFKQMITQSKITVELFVDSREYEAKSH